MKKTLLIITSIVLIISIYYFNRNYVNLEFIDSKNSYKISLGSSKDNCFNRIQEIISKEGYSNLKSGIKLNQTHDGLNLIHHYEIIVTTQLVTLLKDKKNLMEFPQSMIKSHRQNIRFISEAITNDIIEFQNKKQS